MKVQKKNYSWFFAVIVLSLLLALSIYLGLSGWYFSVQRPKVTDFVLGNNIEIVANKNSANSVSLNFNGSFISGEKLNQVVAIKSMQQEGNLYLRAKAFVYSSANEFQPVQLVTTQNWQYNMQDGYYYFTDSILPQSKVSLCTQIFIDEDYSLSSAQNYIITFLIETLSVDHTVEAFWGYNFIE